MAVLTAETRAEWLAARQNSVGASEAAAALGVSDYTTPVELWQTKLGLSRPREESEAMRWGLLLEPLLAQEYERRTGRPVTRRQEFLRHPVYPFITATIDGFAGDRLVEFKTCGAWSKDWGDEDGEDIPDPYKVQVYQQMAVTGADLADVAVLIGGQKFKVYTVRRDAATLNAVEDGVCKFWRCVEDREPPTWGRMTAGSLAAIHPGCSGETHLAGPAARYAERYEAAKKQADEAFSEADRCKLKVMEAMGSHQFAVLPDGRRLKRHLITVPARTVTLSEHTRHYISFAKAGR